MIANGTYIELLAQVESHFMSESLLQIFERKMGMGESNVQDAIDTRGPVYIWFPARLVRPGGWESGASGPQSARDTSSTGTS